MWLIASNISYILKIRNLLIQGVSPIKVSLRTDKNRRKFYCNMCVHARLCVCLYQWRHLHFLRSGPDLLQTTVGYISSKCQGLYWVSNGYEVGNNKRETRCRHKRTLIVKHQGDRQVLRQLPPQYIRCETVWTVRRDSSEGYIYCGVIWGLTQVYLEQILAIELQSQGEIYNSYSAGESNPGPLRVRQWLRLWATAADLYYNFRLLTNSMAYGTRRFNAAFTRALQ